MITSVLVPADQREEAATSDGDQYFVKTDYRFNSAHALTTRYRADDRIATGGGIGGLNTRERGSNTSGLDQDVVGSVTSVLSNRALNEVRVQWALRESFTDTEGYSVDGMPQINRPSGNFGKAQNLPQGRNEKRLQIVENFSYSTGSHDLKFGADVSIIRADSFFPRNRDGNFTFTTDAPFNAARPLHLSDPVRRGDAGSDRGPAERSLLVLRAGSVAAADQPDAQPRRSATIAKPASARSSTCPMTATISSPGSASCGIRSTTARPRCAAATATTSIRAS